MQKGHQQLLSISKRGEVQMISTTLTVDDNGILQLPDDMLEELGWNEGDVLEWIEQDDGSFLLKKVDDAKEEEGRTSQIQQHKEV